MHRAHLDILVTRWPTGALSFPFEWSILKRQGKFHHPRIRVPRILCAKASVRSFCHVCTSFHSKIELEKISKLNVSVANEKLWKLIPRLWPSARSFSPKKESLTKENHSAIIRGLQRMQNDANYMNELEVPHSQLILGHHHTS